MPQPLEDMLIRVWQEAMVEQAKAVSVSGSTYPVKHSKRRALTQVDFTFADKKTARPRATGPMSRAQSAIASPSTSIPIFFILR
jgi:hypothetical protein